jgi:hypothetical protein
MQREWKPTHFGVPGRAMILVLSLSAVAAVGLSFEVWDRSLRFGSRGLRINPNTANVRH